MSIAFKVSFRKASTALIASSETSASSVAFFLAGSSSAFSSCFSCTGSDTCSFTTLGFTSSTGIVSSFTSATGSGFLRASITACFIPIPRKPELPFSMTSYSSLSLVTPSWINASVIASSTVFADTLILPSIVNPSFPRLSISRSLPFYLWHSVHCYNGLPYLPLMRDFPAWHF